MALLNQPPSSFSRILTKGLALRIFVPRESHPGEKRVPIIPLTAGKLVKRGAEVVVERGMGEP